MSDLIENTKATKLNEIFTQDYLKFLTVATEEISKEILVTKINEMKNIFNENKEVNNKFIVKLFMKNVENTILIDTLKEHMKEYLETYSLAQEFLAFMNASAGGVSNNIEAIKKESGKLKSRNYISQNLYNFGEIKSISKMANVIENIYSFEKNNAMFLVLYKNYMYNNISLNEIKDYRNKINEAFYNKKQVNSYFNNNENTDSFYINTWDFIIDSIKTDEKTNLTEKIRAMRGNDLYRPQIKERKEIVFKTNKFNHPLPKEAEDLLESIENNTNICLENRRLLGEEEVIMIDILNKKRIGEVVDDYLQLKDAPVDLTNVNGKTAKELLIITLSNFNDVIASYADEVKEKISSNKNTKMSYSK